MKDKFLGICILVGSIILCAGMIINGYLNYNKDRYYYSSTNMGGYTEHRVFDTHTGTLYYPQGKYNMVTRVFPSGNAP